MSMHTPPPQAYTRDTITRAYEWLQSQPSHIRELAHDIDGMVSLFLQAQRRGGKGPSLQQKPVNPNDFKNDLKNLAEGLRQFEEPANNVAQSHTPTSPQVHSPSLQIPPHAPITAAHSPIPPAAPMPPSNPQVSQQTPPSMTSAATTQSSPQPSTMANQQVNTSNAIQLDARSLDYLAQIRKSMNLSSDQEALRVLIAMGFEHLRQILPKT